MSKKVNHVVSIFYKNVNQKKCTVSCLGNSTCIGTYVEVLECDVAAFTNVDMHMCAGFGATYQEHGGRLHIVIAFEPLGSQHISVMPQSSNNFPARHVEAVYIVVLMQRVLLSAEQQLSIHCRWLCKTTW